MDGEFGVLPGHLPLLAALRTGIVTYRQGNGDDARRGRTRLRRGGTGQARHSHRRVRRARSASIRSSCARSSPRSSKQLAKREGVPIVASEAKGGDAAEIEARAAREVLIARENWLAAQLELYGDPPPATKRPYEEFGPPAPPPDDEIPQDGADDGADAANAKSGSK